MTDCPLTKGELECIECLSEGHNVPDVADMMHLSRWTVQSRVRDAKEKLGAGTAAGLVAIAVRKGWIS
jgi:DNA-binding CsgD family transcriptional regulator